MKTRRMAFLAAALIACGVVNVARADVDRYLTVTVTVDGQQSWKNVLQNSKATTTQKYEIGTGLRSDGKLFGANLNDLDQNRRLSIKTEYLREKGLTQLRAFGFDPKSPNLQGDISTRMQKDSYNCNGDPDCISDTGTKYSALMAAALEPDNSAIMQGDPTFQYYFGYPGCPNRVHVTATSDTTGQTAWGRNKDHVYPYALKTSADWAGSDSDKTSLCNHFTVTLDTKQQKIYADNVYLPSAHGHISRTEFQKTTETEGDLPVPQEVQRWVGDKLREAPLTGSASATIPMTMPLDGNSTVLGTFEGTAKVTLTWAFSTPAGGAK